MYDRQTESLWMTIPGEPVGGKLAESGIKLKRLPVVVTTWRDWRERHPKTSVLSLDTGFNRDYRPGAAYGEYFASPDLMFPAPRLDPRLKPKEEVLAVIVNSQPKAYPLKSLRRQAVINDRLGGQNLVVVTNAATGAARVYLRHQQTFLRLSQNGASLASGEGEWEVTEAALVNRATGERLPRLPAHTAYWFGWSSFYPGTELLRD
jgi:hypothetical protein